MHNYIELAHRTSAPTASVTERLQSNPNLLRSLYYFLADLIPSLAINLDQLKRAIFYGKGDVGEQMQPMTEPMGNAVIAIADPRIVELMHAVIGLATESGEMMQTLCRSIYEGAPIDVVNLAEEAGDNQWYIAKLLRTIGVTLEQCHEMNISKLRIRFPDKFTEQQAISRSLSAEAGALNAALHDDGEPLCPICHDIAAAGFQLYGDKVVHVDPSAVLKWMVDEIKTLRGHATTTLKQSRKP